MPTPRLRRFRGISMPSSAHPAIRAVRRKGAAPSIHGNKLWKSSMVLIDYLHRAALIAPGSRVLDVGCGWGISGIWCARQHDARVTSVDADADVFPFLEATASLNGVSTRPRVARFEQLSTRELAEFDVLLGADICFWDELVRPVGNLVNRALRAGVAQVLIADPERPTFVQMAERALGRHGGELLEWQTRGSNATRGIIMHIDNR